MKFKFGPLRKEGHTKFRLWAPGTATITVDPDGHPQIPMREQELGWRDATVDTAGDTYSFVVDGKPVPDPASRCQAGGVHGRSMLVDSTRYEWRCTGWRGRPWEEAVLYELHVGLAGGYVRAMQRLPDLAALGFTAIELMPVAQFPGTRNWGYDGVLPFAPADCYGTPDDLKAFIDRAHGLGLMVILDVVYNHFGPDGNYLDLYAPEFFRADLKTPWGQAIDFRRDEVRRFFTENALYWIQEFRFDGLRFDAIHAIGDRAWLVELARAIRADVADGRRIHLIAENEDNEAQFLRDGFDAQWNDDFHHVLHVMLTGEKNGYYADYTSPSGEQLARSLREGFVYQGEASAHRSNHPRGTASADLSPTCFVNFLQNHDQIGNRARGERLTVLADENALKAAIALLLLSPFIPLIFMGEEIGSRAPFLYFTDHSPTLARAVREGRRREFAHFIAEGHELADPNDLAAFEHSIPENDAPHAEAWRRLYRELLALRRDLIVPRLAGTRCIFASVLGPKAVQARWRLGDGATLALTCNLGDAPVDANHVPGRQFHGPLYEGQVPPRTTCAWIDP